VQHVLATQGGTGGADRFGNYVCGGHFGFGRDAAHKTPDKFAAVVECLNSSKENAARLRREVGHGMWHG
jgi:hypothetical protein